MYPDEFAHTETHSLSDISRLYITNHCQTTLLWIYVYLLSRTVTNHGGLLRRLSEVGNPKNHTDSTDTTVFYTHIKHIVPYSANIYII